MGKKTSFSHFREASPPHGLQRGNPGAVSCAHRLGGCFGSVSLGLQGRGQALTACGLHPAAAACPEHLLTALFRFSSHLVTPVPSWAAGSPWATAWGELAPAPTSPPRVLPVRQSRVWKENRLPTWNSAPPARGPTLLSRGRLCDPVDGSPPGSPVRGDSPGKNKEWAAVPSSRGSPQHGLNPRPP